MASPQVENGYTRIANELLEALMTADLNGTQFRIMLAVIRESYGRQSTTATLSYSRLATLVDQPRTVVARNLTQLVNRQFLRHEGENVSTWSVQKDYTQWLGSDQSVTSDQSKTSDQTVHKSSDQSVTRDSDQSVTQLKKEERKKESGGGAPADNRYSMNGKTAAAAGETERLSADPNVVKRLKAECGLDHNQATKSAQRRAYTSEELDRLALWYQQKKADKRIDTPGGLLWKNYTQHGDLPDDLPEAPKPTPPPLTEEEKLERYLAEFNNKPVRPMYGRP